MGQKERLKKKDKASRFLPLACKPSCPCRKLEYQQRACSSSTGAPAARKHSVVDVVAAAAGPGVEKWSPLDQWRFSAMPGLGLLRGRGRARDVSEPSREALAALGKLTDSAEAAPQRQVSSAGANAGRRGHWLDAVRLYHCSSSSGVGARSGSRTPATSTGAHQRAAKRGAAGVRAAFTQPWLPQLPGLSPSVACARWGALCAGPSPGRATPGRVAAREQRWWWWRRSAAVGLCSA